MTMPPYLQPGGPAPYPHSQEPALWQPYYGASPLVAFVRFWRKYAVFSGRASRSEYWWWTLASVVIWFVLVIGGVIAGTPGSTVNPDGSTDPGPGFIPFGVLLIAWLLGTIVPTLALTARRLHDANLTALLMLLYLIPYLGAFVLLILALLPPQPAGQRFDRPVWQP